MKPHRPIGRKLGDFDLNGRTYFVAYTAHGVSAFVYADDIARGLVAAKVNDPRSVNRRIAIDGDFREQAPSWQREFKRQVARLCRVDVHGPDESAMREAGDPR